MIKKIASTLGAAALVVATAAPSHAADSESGYLYDSSCLSGTNPYAFATWIGSVSIKAPGNGYYLYYSAHYWANESVRGTSAGGYWRVAVNNYGSTTGYMDKARTYAYCADGS